MVKQTDERASNGVNLGGDLLQEGYLPEREQWDSAHKTSKTTLSEGREERLALRQVSEKDIEIGVSRAQNKVNEVSILFKKPGDYLIQINKELKVGKSSDAIRIAEKDLVQLRIAKKNSKLILPFEEPVESGEASLVVFKFERREPGQVQTPLEKKVSIDSGSALNFMWKGDGALAVMSGDQERGFRVASFESLKLG